MRSRISIRGCVRPSVRPSHTSWISEKWAEIEQNSIRNKTMPFERQFKDKYAGSSPRTHLLSELCSTCSSGSPPVYLVGSQPYLIHRSFVSCLLVFVICYLSAVAFLFLWHFSYQEPWWMAQSGSAFTPPSSLEGQPEIATHVWMNNHTVLIFITELNNRQIATLPQWKWQLNLAVA